MSDFSDYPRTNTPRIDSSRTDSSGVDSLHPENLGAAAAGSASAAASSARKRRNSNIIIAILSVITLMSICLAVYFAVTGAHSSSNAQTSAADSTPSAQAEDNGTEQSGNASAEASGSIAAPAVTDPEAIELLKKYHNRSDDYLSVGAKDAPVVMIEFSDFSCPYCSAYAVNIYPHLKKYIDAGTLRIELYPFTIFEQDYASDIPARAAWAAGKQGKFEEFFELASQAALSEHPVWTDEKVTAIAQEIGVPDVEAFTADMTSEKAHSLVDEWFDIAANVFGMDGTPSFLINNRPVGYDDTPDVFEATIEAAAADAASGVF